MATYAGLKYDSQTPGWTVTYKIRPGTHPVSDTSFYTDISNYLGPTGASWYQQSWWEGNGSHGAQLWAKIFHNTTGQDLTIYQMSFLTCAANSAGQNYRASGGVLNPTVGYGARFQAYYYVEGNSSYSVSDKYDIPDLNPGSSLNKNGWLNTKANGGVGNVARYRDEYGVSSTTRNPHFGGCRSGYYVGDSELSHYVRDTSYGPNVATLTFDEGIPIPDNAYAYLIIHVIDWHGGSSTNQTIVCLGDDPYWSIETPPENKPYIWRMTDMGDGTRQWQKTHYAYEWTGSTWMKLDEKG